ncbi:MAG TPA: aminotransferase class IV [Gemmatimonadales bacterium]|nr:aminotransferase class IV [Gemmatimonadales bacterium]
MTATLIETIRVRNGTAPLWGLHLRRLVRSCRELGVPFPAEFAVPAGGADRVHRLEVTGRGGKARVSVSERRVGQTEPVRLVTSAVVHQPYPHKTTERRQFDEAAAEAARAGADDALLLTAAGLVAETSIWDVFWWEAGRLCAPALELGVLPGVARARIEELTDLAGRREPRGALDGTPMFVANAVRGIVEVATLDGVPVPAPGALGSAVEAAFAALRRQFWA